MVLSVQQPVCLSYTFLSCQKGFAVENVDCLFTGTYEARRSVSYEDGPVDVEKTDVVQVEAYIRQ